ncbi:MAG TPA: sugar transferase [Verrucomicrobiae bacterium]|nr:sugar transferase [Verrucomicrobiae bacterium]
MAGRRLQRMVKRLLDVVGAIVGLTILSPVLLAAAIVVGLTEGRPILYRHERAGLNGKPFTLVKFRTMRSARPDEVWYQTDARRVTRLGRFLRSTSIDELPELWNVLRGDMSLVGPRPLLVEYLGSYTSEEARRHEVRPGFTGWAAVNGRHAVKFEDRLKLDVWYIDHWSLWLDIQILFRTIPQVLRRADVHPTQEFGRVGFPDRFQTGLAEAATRADNDAHPPS